MATVRKVIIPKEKKKDGTWNVKISVNHNGKTLYIKTQHLVGQKQIHGIFLFDRANEKKISTHVRILLGTGVSDQQSGVEKINWILEDPFYKASHESMFIQSADVTCYTIKERNSHRLREKNMMLI